MAGNSISRQDVGSAEWAWKQSLTRFEGRGSLETWESRPTTASKEVLKNAKMCHNTLMFNPHTLTLSHLRNWYFLKSTVNMFRFNMFFLVCFPKVTQGFHCCITVSSKVQLQLNTLFFYHSWCPHDESPCCWLPTTFPLHLMDVCHFNRFNLFYKTDIVDEGEALINK